MEIILGALILVGPIKRLGYQYHAALVLENLTTYFDKVYVISNSRETQSLPFQSDKITFVSDSQSWFEIDEKGVDIFDIPKPRANGMRMLKLAHDAGNDFIMLVDINQYIDAENAQKLRVYCEQLKEQNQPYGYRYRAFQIFDKIAYSDRRHPWLFNLKHPDFHQIQIYPDSIYYRGENFRSENGRFTDAPYYLVDIFPSALTEKDFYEKYDYYITFLNQWYNQKKPRSWKKYVEEQNGKANKMILNSKAKLSKWGKWVVKNFPEDTIFNELDIHLPRLGFKLTKDTMRQLRQEGLSVDIVKTLKPLKHYEFVGEKEFLEAVEKQIGKRQTAKYQTQILKCAETPIKTLN